MDYVFALTTLHAGVLFGVSFIASITFAYGVGRYKKLGKLKKAR